ncbi:Hypothetical protein CINCED_3A001535 [Cinara cedri]|uniref:Uncharacterized protein n=1 Tax=Cinara cedri TaxID=506608 RepID=A0A5E4N5Z4_9HEMI|nr:Hypothetical protein CINCED_3A001535 [Cinara cedri]
MASLDNSMKITEVNSDHTQCLNINCAISACCKHLNFLCSIYMMYATNRTRRFVQGVFKNVICRDELDESVTTCEFCNDKYQGNRANKPTKAQNRTYMELLS